MKKIFYAVIGLLIITIIPTSVFLMGQSSESHRTLTDHQKLARDIFKELIEINTSLNAGSTKAAQAMVARLRNAGFPETDLQLVGPQPQHKNLVVRYHGKGTLAPVLFIGHLDVVDALPQDWSIDPFTFIEKGGFFYGRGTTDMKSDDAALVANLIRLKQEGFVPDRDIIVALTEDEENGTANGIKYLIDNFRELIDADFCINPDGGGGVAKNGKPIVMEVQTCEKIYIDCKFEVRNKGGHSSLPVKENAIYKLAAALTRLAKYTFPIRLNETTRMYFARSALQETGQVKADMLAMMNDPVDTAAANRLAQVSPLYNSKMRTTCVATMLSGGHAENALPQTARANVNCRMLPDDNLENVMATLKAVVADTQVSITCSYASAQAPLSPLRIDVMDPLEQITASMWPGVVVTPTMSTGASDGRILRAAGIPVYGISGMFGDIDDVRAHGRDERIGVKEFYDGTEFMYRYMKLLTTKPH
jgi:acetylornithine deacetylase/succinyl-diaminopimelate desuccinylase-like protein